MFGCAFKMYVNRPMDAAPRWKIFVTHPRAIIGHTNMVRKFENATRAPRESSLRKNKNPPFQSTIRNVVPINAVNDGMNMLHVRINSTLRATYSRFGSSNARICASSCAYARITRTPERFSLTFTDTAASDAWIFSYNS